MQQYMSGINEGYSGLEELLKTRSSELNALLQKVQGAQDEAQAMLEWLDNMKKAAASWSSDSAGTYSVKQQMEQQKVNVWLFIKNKKN